MYAIRIRKKVYNRKYPSYSKNNIQQKKICYGYQFKNPPSDQEALLKNMIDPYICGDMC